VVTTDLRALQHILSHNEVYQKPAEAQRELTRLLGKGVLVAEGPAHRAQRRALNPAFGPGQLRALTGIFLDKANEVLSVLLYSKDVLTVIASSAMC
jgi:cytochrome P450